MNTELVLAMLNGYEIVLALAVVLILFGAKKLPELARGMGQGIKEFKKATRDVHEEIETAMDYESQSNVSRKLPPPETRGRTEDAAGPVGTESKS